jgi:hypothetical protein
MIIKRVNLQILNVSCFQDIDLNWNFLGLIISFVCIFIKIYIKIFDFKNI